jgi:multidrug efflux pump subunit AcrA (membrane-fusion protein)
MELRVLTRVLASVGQQVKRGQRLAEFEPQGKGEKDRRPTLA